MEKSSDITFVICSLNVISLLADREEHKKQELYELKNKVILRLYHRKSAKRLGLYISPRTSKPVVLYSVPIPQTDKKFHFFVPPTSSELSILPRVEGNFSNPKPKYIPALYYAVNVLKNFLNTPLPKPAVKIQKVQVEKKNKKLNRSIFASSYLDSRQPFRPY